MLVTCNVTGRKDQFVCVTIIIISGNSPKLYYNPNVVISVLDNAKKNFCLLTVTKIPRFQFVAVENHKQLKHVMCCNQMSTVALPVEA